MQSCRVQRGSGGSHPAPGGGGGWGRQPAAGQQRGQTLGVCQMEEPGVKNTRGGPADGSGGVGTGCSGMGGPRSGVLDPAGDPPTQQLGPHQSGWQQRLLGSHQAEPGTPKTPGRKSITSTHPAVGTPSPACTHPGGAVRGPWEMQSDK